MNKKEKIKQERDLTNVIYLIKDKNICFGSKQAVMSYFNKLWNIDESKIHTRKIGLSYDHPSIHDLSIFKYEVNNHEAIFIRRIVVDTDEQIETCMELGYLESMPDKTKEDEEQISNKTSTEKILAIKEVLIDGYEGYLIVTDKQEIELGIQAGQDCCEHFGYFMSEDNLSDYIGTTLLDITLTDTALNEAAMKSEGLDSPHWVYEGGIMFVDIKTDRGVLQFVAYNEHNGYYGHDARVKSTFLEHSETL